MKLFSTNIDFKSFFRLAPIPIHDDFGVSLLTGYQGSGKTYFAVYLLHRYISPKRVIYTNIKSLKIPGRKIVYFTLLSEIVNNIEMDCVFVIDEISKKFTKDCKQDKEFYSWLQQSRKRRRVVVLITQEYLQCPIWIRGVTRYVYTTTKVPVFPIFVTYRGYAQLNDDKEWVVIPQDRFIYKRNRFVTKFYDTMEPIPML